MRNLVLKLSTDHPQFKITAGSTFYWSSKDKEVFYEKNGSASSLLHEMGHALLNHQSFGSDMDLLNKEVAAWEKARELAAIYDIAINENTVQNCLDSYRDWLYMRSSCPTCKTHGIQRTQKLYHCLNCGNTWKVTNSVLCRAYRQRKGALHTK